jgi:hypothetical protein
MHLYRQSIILFGIVLPIIIAAVLIGGGFFAKSKIVKSFADKESNFRIYKQGNMDARGIEEQIISQRSHMVRWSEQLSGETASMVASNLREISDKLPSKEIQQTSFERPSSGGGFGAASAQNSSQIRIAFRGTFRTLQDAFLQLETRMPQLQLHELRLEPNPTQSSLLNAQVTFTAWEY